MIGNARIPNYPHFIMKFPQIFSILPILVLSGICSADTLSSRILSVDRVEREYIIYEPESKEKYPVVFVFHGHGGTAKNAVRKFRIHDLWPEACVVYMQGLKTPGRLTDPEGEKNGWQHGSGEQNDRDLRFFDAVYASLENKMDPGNVFSTGHSNGGGFTYLLWQARGEKFRAMAPSSATGGRFVRALKPKPLLHYAGRNDPLVKFAWQQATLKAIHTINGCGKEGHPWHSSGALEGTIYPSTKEAPIVTLLSDGGHKFPKEVPELIVRFFKEQLTNTKMACSSCESTNH